MATPAALLHGKNANSESIILPINLILPIAVRPETFIDPSPSIERAEPEALIREIAKLGT